MMKIVAMSTLLMTLAVILPAQGLDLVKLDTHLIFAVEQVEGTFEGCTTGKTISFVNGGSVTCKSYGYQYAFQPAAAVAIRVYPDGSFTCRVAIGTQLYDASCSSFVAERVRLVRRVAESTSVAANVKRYAIELLDLYERLGL